jgi:NAD(P)-dependent dehydrogenase (short-subunit alcohol dehydrogenase family)
MHAMTGENWWITGASSGLGRELALLLAERGCRVWISARSTVALAQLAAVHPEQLLPLPCDVTDDSAMAALLRQPGAPPWLDGVVVCAGTCEYVDVPELDSAAFHRVFAVNFFGAVNACRAALPLLALAAQQRPNRKPHLLGVGSLASVVGFPRAEAYGASKAAFAYFLDALRCDVHKKIDVTLVSPGFVDTPMTARNDFPMPFVWQARGAAEYIVMRLDARPRRISFPWQLRSLLWLAAALPALWYGRIAPRLAWGARAAGAGAAR